MTIWISGQTDARCANALTAVEPAFVPGVAATGATNAKNPAYAPPAMVTVYANDKITRRKPPMTDMTSTNEPITVKEPKPTQNALEPNVQAPIPRKRGRPRKQPLLFPDMYVKDKPKRKRGRPPKNPLG